MDAVEHMAKRLEVQSLLMCNMFMFNETERLTLCGRVVDLCQDFLSDDGCSVVDKVYFGKIREVYQHNIDHFVNAKMEKGATAVN